MWDDITTQECPNLSNARASHTQSHTTYINFISRALLKWWQNSWTQCFFYISDAYLDFVWFYQKIRTSNVRASGENVLNI